MISFFSVTGYLIANLAVADLGVGLLCIPFTVVYFELNFYWPFGSVMCKVLPALMPCFVMGSVGTMLAISIGKVQLLLGIDSNKSTVLCRYQEPTGSCQYRK